MAVRFAHSELDFKPDVRCERDDIATACPQDANMASTTAFPANLRAARKAKGWSMDQLAAEAETSKGYISDLERGLRPIPPGRTLERFAGALGTTVEALMGQAAPNADSPTIVQPRFLPVRYKVAAGVWFENDVEEPPVTASFAVPPKPAFSRWPQWLELVQGDSADKKILPGQFAHVVDAIEMGYIPKDGDWVILERRRLQGRLRERTVKQVEVRADGSVLFWPRSNNPKWSQPVDPIADIASEDGVEVQIVGRVIGSYDPEY